MDVIFTIDRGQCLLILSKLRGVLRGYERACTRHLPWGVHSLVKRPRPCSRIRLMSPSGRLSCAKCPASPRRIRIHLGSASPFSLRNPSRRLVPRIREHGLTDSRQRGIGGGETERGGEFGQDLGGFRIDALGSVFERLREGAGQAEGLAKGYRRLEWRRSGT